MSYRFRLLARLQASSALPGRCRKFILRAMGLSVQPNAFVAPNVRFTGPNVTVGEGSFINEGVLIDAVAPVVLEARTYVAFRAMLLTTTHEPGGPSKRAGADLARPIRVGAGSWIGAAATILPGVTIAPGCVIGAHALVTRDTAPNGLYVGSPARRLRDLGYD